MDDARSPPSRNIFVHFLALVGSENLLGCSPPGGHLVSQVNWCGKLPTCRHRILTPAYVVGRMLELVGGGLAGRKGEAFFLKRQLSLAGPAMS